MTEILFRCSDAHKLMTEPKTKEAKEAGELSETTKTEIIDFFLNKEFGYEEPTVTQPMIKGITCEQDSMALVQSVLKGSFRLKNQTKYKNEYICGTPDIITEGIVEDIKTSFDLKTFFNAELSKAYYWQLMCYMALTGCKSARLIYCLIPTPEDMVADMIRPFYYKFGTDENQDYKDIEAQIRHNHIDIPNVLPAEKRIKIFNIEYDESQINKLYLNIKKAREYYKTLSL